MNTKQNNNQQVNQKNDWSKREIGALWKKDSANQKYLSGYLNIDELGTKTKVNVVVFSNKNKTKDTAPDFRIYVSLDKNNKNAESVTEKKNQPKDKVVKDSIQEEDLL